MDNEILCKGGCGNLAVYNGWWGIKWKNGNKVRVTCPVIEEKRAKSVSKYRIKEAKLGLNPMQNKVICKKNHSKERNKKASETLKKLGQLKLLPQQTESIELKERRLNKIRKALQKLAKEGRLNHQIESKIKKNIRYKKIKITLKKLAKEKKLPIQNLSEEKRIELGKKISKTLRKNIKNGKIKLNTWGKIYRYKSLMGEIRVRSKWEREVARFLDKKSLYWDYEKLVIPYYDTERNLIRNTIPNFYLKDFNLFIEVKGNGEFRKQNTIDKLKGIRKRGYRVMLFGKEQIKLLKEDPNKIMSKIMGVQYAKN